MTSHSALQSNQTLGSPSVTIAHGLSVRAVRLLEERKLDTENLSRLGWRTSKTNTAGDAIEIPYFMNGQEVNHKWRTLTGEKRFSQEAGGVKCFYNMEAIEEWKGSHRPLLITEGEMDCAVAVQLGYLAVSIPDGAPAKKVDGGIKYDYLEGFPSTGEVIICADGDAAGANLLHDLGVRLGKHRCKWVKYPDGCKDLNDVLIRYDEKRVHELIQSADWLAVDGVYRMGDLPPMEKPKAQPCGIIPINIRLGDFSVWSGVPSHGKTSLTNHIFFLMAQAGWNVGVGSFEQTPQTQHRYNLRTLFLGKPARGVDSMELHAADTFINERYSFIVPNIDSDEDATLGWLLEKMAAAVMRHNVNVFVIDPWNEIEHTFDRRELSQTDYTGFAIKQLKKFAKKYNVHVAVVAHPAKMQRNRDGEYPIPTLYDIADSAHWANKADLGVVVHRKDDVTQVIVQKSRYHQDIGKPDIHLLTYSDETKQFSPAPPEYSMYG